jgi:predicted RNA-binding protein
VIRSPVFYTVPVDSALMCESTVYLNENGKVIEVMSGATRIIMRGDDALCTNIVGEQVTLESVVLAEANLLSHGILFKKR